MYDFKYLATSTVEEDRAVMFGMTDTCQFCLSSSTDSVVSLSVKKIFKLLSNFSQLFLTIGSKTGTSTTLTLIIGNLTKGAMESILPIFDFLRFLIFIAMLECL
jgi:hypothetical protein